MPPIVIADDDARVLALVGQLVSGAGWTFDTARDGAEAWQIVQQVIPDLVLSDINMPGTGGIDLAMKMKQDPRLGRIPLVLMSSADLEAEANAAGCDAFVAKPFGLEDLLGTLRRLVPESK